MPFQSHAQEAYLKHREPSTYEKWVRKYGHYKGKKYKKDSPLRQVAAEAITKQH